MPNVSSMRLQERALSGIIRRGSRMLSSAGVQLVQLDEARLLNEARRRTRLENFGAPDFHEALRRLLQSYETEATLSLLGRIAARQDTLRLLSNRLKMEEDRRRHPDIGAQEIRQPLFVTGLPRTGTTLLHGLLAVDPAHRAALNWEMLLPSPPPDRAHYRTDRRIELAERQIRWFQRLTPEFRRIHPVGARLPEECLIITSHSFMSFQFQTSHYVPSYQAWLESQDLRPAYQVHRHFLQHLQWHGPRGRWILKAPAHLFGIDALLAVYPDAGVVFTHRDPLEVVPSLTSMHTVLRSTFSDGVDPLAIGSEVSRRWADGITRALRARDAAARPDRFFDVQYTDLVRDPMSAVRRIYAHFDMPLTAPAEERMRRFLAQHPKDKHGRHQYSLQQFGFDAGEERQRYRAYCERFGLGTA
jgi:hypothetical protein